jgi:predicted O-methyltransferase YrrM
MPGQRALDPLVAAVFTAIAGRAYSPEESAWIKRIEDRRRALMGSSDTLDYLDFGAGAPSATRTADEMRAGVSARQGVAELTKVASKGPKWAGLLLRLVREVEPTFCVEMGAAAGISAAYQVAGLRLNGTGRFVTIEGGETVAALAGQTLSNLGLGDAAEVKVGRFQDVLEPVLEGNPVDYVFVDGHHDHQATADYFDLIAAKVSRGVLVFDDIDWSPGMRQAWAEITPQVAASFDLGPVGVCVVGPTGHPLHCTIDYT